uniref:hypothetical protein n=1 Tax=Candidatus Fimenecus sp. TaxID=3022888 RepID=UPI004026C1C1
MKLMLDKPSGKYVPLHPKKPPVKYECDCCHRLLNWYKPRNEGIFCEECWEKLTKAR